MNSEVMRLLDDIDKASQRQACFTVQRLTNELRVLLAAPVAVDSPSLLKPPFSVTLQPGEGIQETSKGWMVLPEHAKFSNASAVFKSAGLPAAVIHELLQPTPFDEEKERQLFEEEFVTGKSTQYLAERNENGNYLHEGLFFACSGWLACAKSRANQ